MEKYPQVEEHIRTLFTQNKSIGRHAGGVIVADPRELEETMPMVGVRGELQTPWAEGLNFRNLEDNGFLKFDFLGLTLLRDVENCIGRILKRQNKRVATFDEVKQFFDENLNCRFVKQDDPVVWKHVYEMGHFTGIFQFAQSGARNFAMEAKPQNIEDLAAVTAIYRPGPLKANVHKKYVKVKEEAKKKEPKYAHPVIEEVLGPTYGFFCLAGDTKVLTDIGEIAIEEIVSKKLEVDLISYNNDTKSFEKDKIVQFWDQGEKETIIIETDEGEIELTPDHKVLTQRGWLKAYELTEHDSLISFKHN
jgi:DNA polymerase-3 subunit alpha